MFARLKPYNPKRGATTKTYAAAGNMFRVEQGWYTVGARLAEHLRQVRSDNDDPESALMFDVVDTIAEVEALTANLPKAPGSPAQTNPGKDAKVHDLLAAQVASLARRPSLDTDEPAANPGDEPAADAVPGDGDPAMAAAPLDVPGAPKKRGK